MTKLIFIVFVLLLCGFLVKQAFEYGKADNGKKSDSNLDEKIKNLSDEIDRIEKEQPSAIDEQAKKLYNLKAELEMAKKIKNNLTNKN